MYASAVTMKPDDATMSATLSLHGLDKLLPGYGITMNKDAVPRLRCAQVPPARADAVGRHDLDSASGHRSRGQRPAHGHRKR